MHLQKVVVSFGHEADCSHGRRLPYSLILTQEANCLT